MYLLIDNSDDRELFFALKKKLPWVEKRINMRAGEKRPLLFFLEDFLKKNGCRLSSLTGIAVLVGKGRFTAARIAVTTANALSMVLKIPVIGVKDRNPVQAEKLLKRAGKRLYLSATYSGEAHIGNSKK